MAPHPPPSNTCVVESEDAGSRLDRWLRRRFPDVSCAYLQKIIRKGEIRLDGGRVRGAARLKEGQMLRLPPFLQAELLKRQRVPEYETSQDAARARERAAFARMIIYEDDALYVLNKPYGLPVQGGRGLTRHLDGMLFSLSRNPDKRPRLTHRLDRETAGVLVVAKTRRAAQHLTESFRTRQARKIYWALVHGVPSPPQGKTQKYLKRVEAPEGAFVKITTADDPEGLSAITRYARVASAECASLDLSWVSLKPVTGRTHQLRVHMADLGHPIIGESKYASKCGEKSCPAGLQNRLHLLAKRLIIPHPSGGTLDISAPLPPHMQQSWNHLDFMRIVNDMP